MARDEVAAQVLGFVRAFDTVGFSGSRSLSDQPLLCAEWLARNCCPARVVVGCASGADKVFRDSFAHSEVISAQRSLGRGGFAARSAAVVSAVQSAGGCWVSFPSGVCPESLSPSTRVSACFCGSGSGSWASLALAVGRGVPSLVFLPDGVRPPYWGFVAIGRGWWISLPAVQGSIM